MTLVGIYQETSPPFVSITGNAVKDPPPNCLDNCAALSRSLE
jgi:hypothetical protein